MASTITNYSEEINITFPVPGADNDSQGFRTNFSKIQTSLGIAAQEITELQLAVNNPANVILNSYTPSELYTYTLGTTVDDGTMVFLTTGYFKPVYINSGTWYTMTGTGVTLP